MLRAFAATALAIVMLAVAGAPHSHAGPQDRHDCVACVTANAEPPATPSFDAPLAAPAERASAAPGLAPVTGAPLGAVPGQSPPLA